MDTKIYGFYANVEMLEQEEVFRRLFCGLSRERQQKTERIRPATDRACSLMAGVLLDFGLFRLHGLRERDMVFRYGAQGKPYLRDYPHIQFNLSHSGDYALAVFAPTAVGCDIQQREQAKNSKRIAARFFSEEEQRALEEGWDFYRIWARKESYLKLTGAGMALDLRSFRVTDGICRAGEAGTAQKICSEGANGSGAAELFADAGLSDDTEQPADAGLSTDAEQPGDVRLSDDAVRSAAALADGCVDLPELPCRFADFGFSGYCLSACYASAELLPAAWIQPELSDFLNIC